MQWEYDKAKDTVLIEELATASKWQIRISLGNDVRFSGFSL